MKPFYFDYNATTPAMPEVISAMIPFFAEQFGNPANKSCMLGRAADRAIERAREQTAALIGAQSNQITFTSGATEAINLAIKGHVQSNAYRGKHILALPTEHSAVINTLAFLGKHDFEIEFIPLNEKGLPKLDAFQSLLRPDTILVCCMLANNETGQIYPVKEITKIAHKAGSFVLCDATQACGKIQLDVVASGVDYLAISAHKFAGPKGIGALYCSKKPNEELLTPLFHGGGQENGMRSGTLNVPGIVGMGKAAEIAHTFLREHQIRYESIRQYLLQFFSNEMGAFVLNDEAMLSNTLYLRIPGIEAKQLIKTIPEVCFSSGSACQSIDGQISHVPLALGYSKQEAKCFFRLSWGWATKMKEAEQIAGLFLRTLS